MTLGFTLKTGDLLMRCFSAVTHSSAEYNRSFILLCVHMEGY